METGETVLIAKKYPPENLRTNRSSIIRDETHPLNGEYVLLPSGRRCKVPKRQTNRYKNAFVPRSIELLNFS